MSATTVATGPTPACESGPWHEGEAVAHLFVDQDGDVVGSLVGDDQVETAVAVDVGDGDSDRIGAREEAVTAVERRCYRTCRYRGRVDEDVVAAAIGDDQVEDSVVVEVGQRDGARGDQPGGRISQDGRTAADGLNDELIGELIGKDKRGRGCSARRVDGQRHLLVEVSDRLERAVAVTDQDLHVAQRVADEQVGLAVAGQVGDRQAIGFKSNVDQGRRQEASVAVTAVDEESIGAEDGQSGHGRYR